MRNLISCLILLYLTACASVPQDASWPAELPERTYFVNYYKQNLANQPHQTLDNYLSWIVKFYEGTTLQPKGWLASSVDVIDSVPTAQQPQLQEDMYALGKAISAEWAMDNRVRKLNTRNMVVWGSAMREAVVKDDVVNLVALIQDDVDDLLLGSIDKKQITDDRYYVSEYNEFF